MEKEFERTRRVKFRDINRLSKKYISDNTEEVQVINQRMILTVSVLYLFVIICYNIIVPFFFAEWGVTYVYQIALIVHIPIVLFYIIRYRKKLRSPKEIQVVSVITQLYVMAFLVVVSIVPFEKEQPAVYFTPIAMGFTVMFIYTFHTAVTLCIIEAASIIVASFIFKSTEVFNINLFAVILTLVIAVYALYVLYSNRINESWHRKKLRKMGQTDKLTQIYNRAATEMLSKEYMQANRDTNFALMIIDIDYFKSVNDTYGHQTGDTVIQTVAHIIEDAAGPDNITGRMGGDEFVIFIKAWETQNDIKRIAAEILKKAKKVEMPDDRVHISCSIGVCALPGEEWMEYDDMFSCADKALYYIKEHGKNSCAFYAKSV